MLCWIGLVLWHKKKTVFYYFALLDRIGVVTQEENSLLLLCFVGSDWCCDTWRKQFIITLLCWIGLVLWHKKITVFYYFALLDRIGVVTQEENSFLLLCSVGSDWCCDTKENSFLLDCSVGSDWCCDTRRKQFFIRLLCWIGLVLWHKKKTVFFIRLLCWIGLVLWHKKKTVFYYFALLDRIGVVTQEENSFLLLCSVGSDWCCDTWRKQFIITLLCWIRLVLWHLKKTVFYYFALLDRIGVVTQEENSFLLLCFVGSDWCCDTRRKQFFITLLCWIGLVLWHLKKTVYYYIALLDRIGVVTQEENSFFIRLLCWIGLVLWHKKITVFFIRLLCWIGLVLWHKKKTVFLLDCFVGLDWCCDTRGKQFLLDCFVGLDWCCDTRG